jgi:hypothetical protein
MAIEVVLPRLNSYKKQRINTREGIAKVTGEVPFMGPIIMMIGFWMAMKWYMR